MPKVSVLMPTYNTDPKHLREAIESILAQTFTDFEFLILDDCSTETSVKETIASYTDPRIRFFENERNMGISPSRNRLIDLSEGEYLAVFDHDDISLPERLEKQVAFLDSHPEVGVLGTAVEEFPKIKLVRHPSDNTSIEEYLMYKCVVVHTSSMLRKKVLTDNNIKYEENFSPAEDYLLWIRLLGKTKFVNLPDLLTRYRVHAQNTSHQAQFKMQCASLAIISLANRIHPDIKERMESKRTVKTTYRFLGIKILSVKERDRRKQYLLFGRFALLKSRTSFDFNQQ